MGPKARPFERVWIVLWLYSATLLKKAGSIKQYKVREAPMLPKRGRGPVHSVGIQTKIRGGAYGQVVRDAENRAYHG